VPLSASIEAQFIETKVLFSPEFDEIIQKYDDRTAVQRVLFRVDSKHFVTTGDDQDEKDCIDLRTDRGSHHGSNDVCHAALHAQDWF